MNEVEVCAGAMPLVCWIALCANALAGVLLLRQWRGARRSQAAEQPELDAATLRDLGAARSELDSYWAEATHAAEPTRRRVAAIWRHAGAVP